MYTIYQAIGKNARPLKDAARPHEAWAYAEQFLVKTRF